MKVFVLGVQLGADQGDEIFSSSASDSLVTWRGVLTGWKISCYGRIYKPETPWWRAICWMPSFTRMQNTGRPLQLWHSPTFSEIGRQEKIKIGWRDDLSFDD